MRRLQVSAMAHSISVRPFAPRDAEPVRDLFITVNRRLAPTAMKADFEAYIVRSLSEEIDHIARYYAVRQGGFWVAVDGDKVVGMFGLAPVSDAAMELRRMYVASAWRRRGLARQMLAHAEDEARRLGYRLMVLSTSELQEAALALYRAEGFRYVREERADAATNKTIGGGIVRHHFEKDLARPAPGKPTASD